MWSRSILAEEEYLVPLCACPGSRLSYRARLFPLTADKLEPDNLKDAIVAGTRIEVHQRKETVDTAGAIGNEPHGRGNSISALVPY